MKFEFNLSLEELEKRTDKDILIRKPMLGVDAKEYENLQDGDKQALAHLVKAAMYANSIYMKQDNELNLRSRLFLKKKLKTATSKPNLQKFYLTLNLEL